jgi:hypothetical protein
VGHPATLGAAMAANPIGHLFRRVVFYSWLTLWLMETITHPDQLQTMTLWLNMQFLLYFSVSPSSTWEVGWLHTAVWGSMHSLAPGYLVMLHFIHDSGSIIKGFDILDGAHLRQYCAGTTWCVNGTKSSFAAGASGFRGTFDCLPGWALMRSVLLHFAPILLLHLDLRLNFAELAITHAKMRCVAVQFYLMLVAPVWLALVHRDVVFPGAWTWKCASTPAIPAACVDVKSRARSCPTPIQLAITPSSHRYHIPADRFAMFDLFTNVVNIPAAFLSVIWLRRRLISSATLPKQD